MPSTPGVQQSPGSQSQPQPPNSSNSNSRGSFAAALRNLAKQADVKDDDSNPPNNDNRNSSSNNRLEPGNPMADARTGSMADNRSRNDSRSSDLTKKRTSPTPPEKVAIEILTYSQITVG
jgi:hypothetical protein